MAASTVLVTPNGIVVLGDDGTQSTLALPSGVQMVPGVSSRCAILGGSIIITDGVSTPLWLGPDLILRPLSELAPGAPPTLSIGGAGNYSGTRSCRVTFTCKNKNGALLFESPPSNVSNSVTVAAQLIHFANLPLPTVDSGMTGRRIYLTTTGGATYVFAFDIDDVTTTTWDDDTSDAALSLLALDPTLVAAPPDLTLVVTWKNRLWGKTQIDQLAGSLPLLIDHWPNTFPIDPRFTDGFGITGFLPRRDDMLIGRRHYLWQLTGSDESTFTLVKLAENRGIVAPYSCIVIFDTGYALSDDGFIAYDSAGVRSISDEQTRPWWTTDTYFNRALFPLVFTGWDPVRAKLMVFVPLAGSSVINAWLEYDLLNGTWWGPHVDAAVPAWTACGVAPDVNNVLRFIACGSDGFCYAFTPGVWTDGSSSAIAMDAIGKFHSGQPPEPDMTHVWLQPRIFTKKESGGTLLVTPTVGDISSAPGATFSHDLTVERERLPRMGVGRLCSLRMQESTAGQEVVVYGYELPYSDAGKR